MTNLPYVCRSCARRWGRLSPSQPTTTILNSPRSSARSPRHPSRGIAVAATPRPPKPLFDRAGFASSEPTQPHPLPDRAPPAPPAKNPQLIPPTSLALRWTTPPPTPTQLHLSNRLFTSHPATFLSSSPYYRSLSSTPTTTSSKPSSPSASSSSSSHPPPTLPLIPEVIFLGRSNVGKSSLLNALLSAPSLCHTSSRPGRTRSMNLISVAANKLIVVDMPGYGKGSRASWGTEILAYIRQRKQLRRVFLLIDAEHGFKSSDLDLLRILAGEGVSYQVVLSKADKVLWKGGKGRGRVGKLREVMEGVRAVVDPGWGKEGRERREAVREGGVPAWGEVLAVSGEKKIAGEALGVANLRWAVLRAVGLDAAGGKKARVREIEREGEGEGEGMLRSADGD